MIKDFDSWNNLKKKIDEQNRINIITGSIWLCNFGLNIGYEIDGKNETYVRPALVILGFGKGGGIVLPLTTARKDSKYFKAINSESSVNLTQVKYLDAKRFNRFIKSVPLNILEEIIHDFTLIFNEKPPRQ